MSEPSAPRASRSPVPRTFSEGARSWGPVSLVGLLLAAGLLAFLGSVAIAPAPHGMSHGAPVPLGATHAAARASPTSGPYVDCDGMYWSSWYNASYVPSFCYGHDEPTMSYQSTVAGSGANASFQVVLPADSGSYAQGDFYATIWFGGVVYDTASTGGGNQAFLELQFYPAAPTYTGAGSGTKDCLPDGGYSPSFTAGANKWFACAIVWQLQTSGSYLLENAAYAGPIDSGGSTAILSMKSNDRIFVNYSGIAQSSAQAWNLSVRDVTASSGGYALLKNGSLVLSPYYSTAAPGNTLKWGASNPGAIAFAYEIGHAYNVGSCYPGDGGCDSYWPVRWSQSGQVQLALPKLGSPSVASYPTKIALSSSQGGEYEVNSSSCKSPSTNSSKNCMYPYFTWRAGSYAFDFTTGSVTNTTRDYGNKYEFPASISSAGQWNAAVQTAPWGTVHFVVYPANATATFSAAGQTTSLSLAANRTASGQYVEGLYWFNVSAPGCSRHATTLYVSTGGSYNQSIFLTCGGNTLTAKATVSPGTGTFPLNVTFNGSATGGVAPYNFSWSFGDGGHGFGSAPRHTYTAPSNYSVTLIVADHGGNGTLTTIYVVVTEPSCAGVNRSVALGVFEYCHLNKGQQATFTFTVTQNDWYNEGAVNIYALDGTTTGRTPVFKIGSGMGGTPSLTKAKQKASGPNAHIQVILNILGANKYRGWGNYWVVVRAWNGSGGFCFVAAYDNGTLPSNPTCSKAVMAPRSGGGHPSAPRSGPVAPAQEPRPSTLGHAARGTGPVPSAPAPTTPLTTATALLPRTYVLKGD